ncbi:hypothetical protein ACFOY2_04785 [Nonomuraea purpurea]|uniref:Uncharacterized protein n=1 Tax=Nonomuraea purpurea TaxID=1849276 RepID=A0ABV8G0K4_9ACTN
MRRFGLHSGTAAPHTCSIGDVVSAPAGGGTGADVVPARATILAGSAPKIYA